MTEAEWLACADSQSMLLSLPAATCDRKLRLFGCACCRRIWEELSDPRCRAAVVASEKFVDGLWSERDLEMFSAGANEARKEGLADGDGNETLRSFGAYAASYVSRPSLSVTGLARAIGAAIDVRVYGGDAEVDPNAQVAAELQAQVTFLRDIFGNPFRPATFDPAWRTDTAVALAQQMYESWDFGAMPILADALQDAGCSSDDILNHCRDEQQVHVRGCWVVDLVLGRE